MEGALWAVFVVLLVGLATIAEQVNRAVRHLKKLETLLDRLEPQLRELNKSVQNVESAIEHQQRKS